MEKNRTIGFCVPIESSKEIIDKQRKNEEECIASYNKKYTDLGQIPPPYEEYIKDGWKYRTYPNGKMEFIAIHKFDWTKLHGSNPAYKDSERPQ